MNQYRFSFSVIFLSLLLTPSWTTSLPNSHDVLATSLSNSANLEYNYLDNHININDVLYYGFFIDEITANSLQRYTQNVLGKLLTHVPQVKKFFETVDTGNDHLKYFVKPLDPATGEFDPYYHITTKYCGNGINCESYLEKANSSLGKRFKTNLVGFYFSHRTYGVRVKLTKVQQHLFDMEERNSILANTEFRNRKSAFSVGIGNGDYPGIHFQLQKPNFHPTTSRAHVTLGVAEGFKPVDTGLDLLNIIKYEIEEEPHIEIKIGKLGTLRIFENSNINQTMFVIYPHLKLKVQSTLLGYKLMP